MSRFYNSRFLNGNNPLKYCVRQNLCPLNLLLHFNVFSPSVRVSVITVAFDLLTQLIGLLASENEYPQKYFYILFYLETSFNSIFYKILLCCEKNVIFSCFLEAKSSPIQSLEPSVRNA